jgi:pimeloyl-ACP methyl ester carboxylesterase
MTELSAVPEAAVPIQFDAAGSWCFGWYHRAAASARRGVGVVFCRPLGYEAMCTYQMYAELADMLARAGFDVLRLDYHGTGDSAGGDGDPARVPAWIESIVRGTAELKRMAGVEQLAFVGVRLGATLAVQAACALGGVDSLVMWAPCVTGRAFTRELRAASGSRADGAGSAGAGEMEALGYLYTEQTLRDLEALDCRRVPVNPARRVLIIGRDDLPVEGPLPAAYRAMGMEVGYEVLPGYARMMVEPHQGVLNYASLNAIADWLLAALPPPRGSLAPPGAVAAFRVGELPGGIREIPVTFGPGDGLFGILADPPADTAQPGRRETALLMLNVGGNYRIGPNRLYVKMARALAANGYRVLRFDLTGLGDSRAEPGPRTHNYFSKDSAGDVIAAIDRMAAEGCTRFWVMGVCSGSYVAFQAALADPRVSGQVLMNSRLLEWRDDTDEDMWQASMQTHYKSTAFYGRSLMRPEVYARLLRGEVDVNGIARRIATVIEARVKRAVGRLLHREAREESVLDHTRRLSARGTDTLIVVSAQDDGRDYLEFHYGRRGSRLGGDPNFRMIVVDGADHTFSSVDSQQMVIGTVREHLEQRLARTL